MSSCIGFTFLVLAHPGSPGQRAIKRVCVCVCVKGVMLFGCRMLEVVGGKLVILVAKMA